MLHAMQSELCELQELVFCEFAYGFWFLLWKANQGFNILRFQLFLFT